MAESGMIPGVRPRDDKSTSLGNLSINTDALVALAQASNQALLAPARQRLETDAFTATADIGRKFDKLMKFFGADKDKTFNKELNGKKASGKFKDIPSGLEAIYRAVNVQTRLLTRLLAGRNRSGGGLATSGLSDNVVKKLMPMKKSATLTRGTVLKHSPEAVYIADVLSKKLDRMKRVQKKGGFFGALLAGIGAVIGGIFALVKRLWKWFSSLRWVARLLSGLKGFFGGLLGKLWGGLKKFFGFGPNGLFTKHKRERQAYEMYREQVKMDRQKRKDALVQARKDRNAEDVAAGKRAKEWQKRARKERNELRRRNRDLTGEKRQSVKEYNDRVYKDTVERSKQQMKLDRQMAQQKYKDQVKQDKVLRKQERRDLRRAKTANWGARAAMGLAGTAYAVLDGVSAYNDAKDRGMSSGRAAGEAVAGGGLLNNVAKYAAMGATFGPWGAAAGAAIGVVLTAIGPEAIGTLIDKLKGVYGFTLEKAIKAAYKASTDEREAVRQGTTKEKAQYELRKKAKERLKLIGTSQGFEDISGDNLGHTMYVNKSLGKMMTDSNALGYTIGDTERLLSMQKSDPEFFKAFAVGAGKTIEQFAADLKARQELALKGFADETANAFGSGWDDLTEANKQQYIKTRKDLFISSAQTGGLKDTRKTAKEEAERIRKLYEEGKASEDAVLAADSKFKTSDTEYKKSQVRTATLNARAKAQQDLSRSNFDTEAKYQAAISAKTNELMKDWMKNNVETNEEMMGIYGDGFEQMVEELRKLSQATIDGNKEDVNKKNYQAMMENQFRMQQFIKTGKFSSFGEGVDKDAMAEFVKNSMSNYDPTKIYDPSGKGAAVQDNEDPDNEAAKSAIKTAEGVRDMATQMSKGLQIENKDGKSLHTADSKAASALQDIAKFQQRADVANAAKYAEKGDGTKTNIALQKGISSGVIQDWELANGFTSNIKYKLSKIDPSIDWQEAGDVFRPSLTNGLSLTGRALIENTSSGLKGTTIHPNDVIGAAMKGTTAGDAISKIMTGAAPPPPVSKAGVPFPLQIINNTQSATPAWVSNLMEKLDKMLAALAKNTSSVSSVTNFYPRLSEKELMKSNPYLV